jgi:hypothetical protein
VNRYHYGLCLQKNITAQTIGTKGWKVAGTTEKRNVSDVAFFIVLDNVCGVLQKENSKHG